MDSSSRRATARRFLSIAILIAIAAIALLYYRRHPSDFRLLTTVSPWAVLALLAMKTVGFLVNGLQLKYIAAAWEVHLTFAQWFGLSRITQATNLLLPFGGAPVKAVYLKRFHQMPYGAFVATMALADLLKIIVASLIAIGCVFLIGNPAAELKLPAFAALSGAVFILAVACAVGARWATRMPRLAGLLASWNEARANGLLLARLIALHVATMLITGAEVCVAFYAFGQVVPLEVALVISASSIVTAVFNLAPGNLGIREMIFAGLSNLLGPGANAGLHAAVLGRALTALGTLASAPWFARRLARDSVLKQP